MRSLLAFGLILMLSACESQDDEWERWFVLDDVIYPARNVALAAQWYELETGQWPTSIEQVADLDDVLGQATSQPPEPVPVPDSGKFNSIRFEVVNDSLLRIHYNLRAFDMPSPGEVDMYEDGGPPQKYVPPAVAVSVSRGVMEVPVCCREEYDRGTRVLIAEAAARTEGGKSYEFEDEERELQPVIFLEPLGGTTNR